MEDSNINLKKEGPKLMIFEKSSYIRDIQEVQSAWLGTNM